MTAIRTGRLDEFVIQVVCRVGRRKDLTKFPGLMCRLSWPRVFPVRLSSRTRFQSSGDGIDDASHWAGSPLEGDGDVCLCRGL